MYQSLIELISDIGALRFMGSGDRYQSLIELISDFALTFVCLDLLWYQSLIELISDECYANDAGQSNGVSISYRVNF